MRHESWSCMTANPMTRFDNAEEANENVMKIETNNYY